MSGIKSEPGESVSFIEKSGLGSSKSLENDFKLTKNHGNQFVLAFQSSVKNEENYNEKDVITGTIALECKYCGKNFSDRMALKVHEKIHIVKNLSYKCNFCEKKFGSSQQAKNHEKVHTG